MKTYPVFQQTYYSDGDGLLLGVFKTKKDVYRFIKREFPEYKRRRNQEGFTLNGIETSMTWFNDEEYKFIECNLDYPVNIVIG